jgi:hypothetical protein
MIQIPTLGVAFKGNTLDAFHLAAGEFVAWLRERFGGPAAA